MARRSEANPQGRRGEPGVGCGAALRLLSTESKLTETEFPGCLGVAAEPLIGSGEKEMGVGIVGIGAIIAFTSTAAAGIVFTTAVRRET